MAPRARLFLWWALFLAAAGVAGYAVHRLHRTAQREIATQGELVLERARSEALRRIDSSTEEAREAIFTELAGFHVDGLGATLRRWDAGNAVVTGTFLWDAATGFAPENSWPADAPRREDVAALWQEFREWRQTHTGERSRTQASGRFHTGSYRTLDNPRLPATSLRYQGENLELLQDAGRVVDPWVGWAGSGENPGQPWVIWYQAGPGSPVRGCFVDVAPTRQLIEREFAGERAAVRLSLRWVEAGTAPEAMLPGLPGYSLEAERGELFAQKAADARLNASVAALLLGVFLLGAAALGLRTWREARDAGRKINFVTQVSHELRTPLTSIRMFADMLAVPGITEEKRLKFAGTIGAESARLGGLIERLLAFNALEKGVNRAVLAPLDVSALVREVVEETAAKLAEAGLQPVLQLPAAPAMALGDRSMVKQALLNLLDNACKYAVAGGTVEISARVAADGVAVRVTDRGEGIPAGIRDRLFEPFVQGGQTLTTKSPGVGLGLSLARGLLRQGGADLFLVPSPHGASFEIRLPAASFP